MAGRGQGGGCGCDSPDLLVYNCIHWDMFQGLLLVADLCIDNIGVTPYR